MPKKLKITSLIIVFCLYFLFFLILPALAADEPITLKLQTVFSTLDRDYNITPSAFGEYVKALYVFGSAALVVIAIVMIMIGGLQWVTAAGDSGRIGKAKDTIFKAFIGLMISVFAVYLLQLFNPGATVFKPLNLDVIGQAKCCKVSSTYIYVVPLGNKTAQDVCEKDKKGQLQKDDTECKKAGAQPPEQPPPETITCTAHQDPTSCRLDTANNCEWKDSTGPGIPGTCQAKVEGGAESKLIQAWGCATTSPATKGTCLANASRGCFWSSKFCGINPGLTTQQIHDLESAGYEYKCPEKLDPTACLGTNNCFWYGTYHCIDQNTLTTNYTTKNCLDRGKDKNICTTYKCAYYEDKCQNAVHLNESCTTHDQCGDLAYCHGPGTDVGICKPLIARDQNCYGVQAGWTTAIVASACARCCVTDNCTERVFTTGGICQ